MHGAAVIDNVITTAGRVVYVRSDTAGACAGAVATVRTATGGADVADWTVSCDAGVTDLFAVAGRRSRFGALPGFDATVRVTAASLYGSLTGVYTIVGGAVRLLRANDRIEVDTELVVDYGRLLGLSAGTATPRDVLGPFGQLRGDFAVFSAWCGLLMSCADDEFAAGGVVAALIEAEAHCPPPVRGEPT